MRSTRSRCPNAGHAGWWDSAEPRNNICRPNRKTRTDCGSGSSRWPVNMAAMDIGESRPCSSRKGGAQITSEWSALAAGGAKGAAETTQTGPALVRRWLLYPPPGGVSEPCLVVRESLAITVRRRLTSWDVQEVLSELFLYRGCPTHIRSDNGPECIARALRAWCGMLTIAPLCIEPGSPWENVSKRF
jgi:hypothetical protein